MDKVSNSDHSELLISYNLSCLSKYLDIGPKLIEYDNDSI